MILKSSSLSDIPVIMQIIADAQNYLATLNIDQWQDGYPTKERMILDISNKDSYVIVNDDNEIMGTTMFSTKPEPTYLNIDGEWITDTKAKYGVIHRLAVSDKYRNSGLAKFVFNHCEMDLKKQGIKSMRIDTHRDNKGMQALLNKLEYQYCGVIILTSGAERLAYEKLIED
jgi:ribosomal protein S18 acetylase RimI-like enzyme